MHYLKDTAFILRRVNFGDSDRYITLFTKNHGKIEVVAKGVRKITSRRASSVELLNLIEFQAIKSSKNYILTEVKLVSSYEGLKNQLTNIEKVFMMCELMDAIMPNGVVHEDVFDLLMRAADKICDDEKNMAYFQAKLLSLLGFWDGKTSFKNADHVTAYVEQIIERKLKSTDSFTSAGSA